MGVEEGDGEGLYNYHKLGIYDSESGIVVCGILNAKKY